MPRLPVTLNPEHETEIVEDISESSAEHFGLFVVPGEHMSIVNVGKEQWTSGLGSWRRPPVENEKSLRVILGDSK